MIEYDALSQKPKVFKSLTGTTVPEFEELREKTYPVWQGQERERLNRADRQRAMGGGRKYEVKFQGVRLLLWGGQVHR